jgi:hypothetical protein
MVYYDTTALSVTLLQLVPSKKAGTDPPDSSVQNTMAPVVAVKDDNCDTVLLYNVIGAVFNVSSVGLNVIVVGDVIV